MADISVLPSNPKLKLKGSGSIWGLISFIFVAVLLTYFIFFVVFGYSVKPGFIGVRLIKFGPFRGMTESGLRPGSHWGVPGGFYTVVHPVPQTLQFLNFNRDPSDSTTDLPFLEIQTSDRATVDVDITVASRFYSRPGESDETTYGDVLDAVKTNKKIKHGGPADLIKTLGIAPDRWLNHIRRSAEDELKRALGALSTGDFYDPKKRETQIALAHESMNRALAPVGIRIESVLLRRYTYREGRIDEAIFQKNLQDQEERLNVAASKLAEAQASLEQVAAEADAKISTLRVEGENKARVIRSEGELYENEKKAQGDLESASAKAEVDRLRSQALAKARGAEIYVAKELAPLVGSIRGGVVSEMDPYNLDEWISRLGVSQKKEGGQ
jgi:regulator of protease activity HflC (stomatin/prohibitin superfamily)